MSKIKSVDSAFRDHVWILQRPSETTNSNSPRSCTVAAIACNLGNVARKVDGRIGDKYQLSAVLGQGATGTVYAAKNLRTQRRIAIKSLHLRPDLTPGCADLLRFEQEARIAGSIESPHLVQVFDIEHDPTTDLPFLVMELLRGEDLQSLLDRVGPLPVDAALRIAAQVCSGLAAAHSANVIHRDIKPANVFLTRQEKGTIVVKILDFGIAKIRRLPDGAADSEALQAPAVSMTDTGQMLGSPLFMSPEQVDETKHVDARSDLFSLGTTLYTMLTGRAPHAEVKSFYLLLRRLLNGPPPPIRTVAPWVSSEVEGFLQKACAFDRNDRFSNANEMLVALERLLPQGHDLREEMLIGLETSALSSGEVFGSDPEGSAKKQLSTEPNDSSIISSAPKVIQSDMPGGLDPYAATMQGPAEPAIAVTLPIESKSAVLPEQPNLAATLPVESKPAAVLNAKSTAPVKVEVASTPASASSVEPRAEINRTPIVVIMVIIVVALVAGLFLFAR